MTASSLASGSVSAAPAATPPPRLLERVRDRVRLLHYSEGLRLRVKDVEFERREIIVREGKGNKGRVTVLPENLIAPLREQIERARALHRKDLDDGLGAVWLPDALAVKYPNAAKTWGWQYVFPSPGRSTDPRSGLQRRHA